MTSLIRSVIQDSFVFFFLISITAGCASSHKTITTETTITRPAVEESERNPNAALDGSSVPQEVEKKETTTTTTETKPEHAGILGTTFHVIGYIIALPFTIIAGLFHIIF